MTNRRLFLLLCPAAQGETVVSCIKMCRVLARSHKGLVDEAFLRCHSPGTLIPASSFLESERQGSAGLVGSAEKAGRADSGNGTFHSLSSFNCRRDRSLDGDISDKPTLKKAGRKQHGERHRTPILKHIPENHPFRARPIHLITSIKCSPPPFGSITKIQ